MSCGDIEIESEGKIELRRKSKRSNVFMLYMNNQLVMEMRAARAMSFLDGWRAGRESAVAITKALIKEAEEKKRSPQKKEFTSLE